MIIIRYTFRSMYVCICKGVTDSAIRREVRAGATSFREVRDRLGVATQCGKCACEARQVIAQAVQPATEPPAPVTPGLWEPAAALA